MEEICDFSDIIQVGVYRRGDGRKYDNYTVEILLRSGKRLVMGEYLSYHEYVGDTFIKKNYKGADEETNRNREYSNYICRILGSVLGVDCAGIEEGERLVVKREFQRVLPQFVVNTEWWWNKELIEIAIMIAIALFFVFLTEIIRK